MRFQKQNTPTSMAHFGRAIKALWSSCNLGAWTQPRPQCTSPQSSNSFVLVWPWGWSCWTTTSTACDQHERAQTGLFQVTSSCSGRPTAKRFKHEAASKTKASLMYCVKNLSQKISVSHNNTKKLSCLCYFCRGSLSQTLVFQQPNKGHGLLQSGMSTLKGLATFWSQYLFA